MTLGGLLLLVACKGTEEKKETVKIADSGPKPVEIVTTNMNFILPDSISSGWQTFEYKNQSKETHFFLMEKYPPGKSIEDAATEVGPAFQQGMNLIIEGKMEEAMAEFGKLPEWFQQVEFKGGSGLVSPGNTSKTTIKLEPGYYLIECYVKMADGTFHGSMGMVEEVIVTSDTIAVPEFDVTARVSISSTAGITINDSLDVGKQTVLVSFEDQIVHEHFVGHDVNLVRVADGADLDELDAWLNWAAPAGLSDPAPEGFTFLGGVNDMGAGQMGYFHTDLSPGNYLLVAEVPNARAKNMMVEFTIK